MLVELVVELVVSLLFHGRRSVLWEIPFCVWASAGLIALGVVAMNMAFAGTGPPRPMLFVLTGVCLVLSPVPLFLFPRKRR